MRLVHTLPPSFPEATPNALLSFSDDARWEVLCGDAGHWRLGYYRPEVSRADEVKELEWHDCPEAFILLQGRVTLLVDEGEGAGVHELPLEPFRPALVTGRHAGFCPDGPFTGLCAVIERDAFRTEYTPK